MSNSQKSKVWYPLEARGEAISCVKWYINVGQIEKKKTNEKISFLSIAGDSNPPLPFFRKVG